VDSAAKRILEINPTHPMIIHLAETLSKNSDKKSQRIDDVAWLLLDQARIIEGEIPPDPSAFAKRMADIITSGLTA
jgi:molecular chaperone HtpG